MSLRLALRELADALLPQRCVVCERFGAAIHPECITSLPAAIPPRCDRCWRPSAVSPCASCVRTPPLFEALRTPYRFEGPVRRALLEAKFRGMTALLPPLAEVAASLVPSAWAISAVVPVPLHPGRERRRGYNQAAIAATAVARVLDVPVSASMLRRTRATAPQATLGADARAANLTFAFTANGGAAGQRVLLVDDVTTTGATFEACARALRDASVGSVFALAIARED